MAFCNYLSDAPVSELSLELLLLQVVLPALLEQGHTRQWLKGLVRAWTVTAGLPGLALDQPRVCVCVCVCVCV